MSRPLRDVVVADPSLPADLARALAGTGPAVRVVPSAVAGSVPSPTSVPDEVAVAVATSGSTGEPRTVLLGAAALHASAQATHARLSGPGRWLLALPVDHVAGLQVLVRSTLAGTTPVTLPPGPFTAAGFAVATARLDRSAPRYTSLVPTQLGRVLDDPAARDALVTFDAVLVGGAATPTALLERARDAGARVVTTYGMTETCGGCVYDGRPLDGVRVRLSDEGRILLAGDVLATGYAQRPDLDAAAFVTFDNVPHLRTSDLGRLDGDVLTVLGRADDVLVTGGVNVAPAAVEDVLAALPSVAHALVVGVPDDEWGQCVTALVVPRAGLAAPTLDELRAAVLATLGPAHAPRALVVVDGLPLRGPGKPDRAAATSIATAARQDPRPQPTSPIRSHT
ncbi:o-succinylbenzoate--CoA ligase [Cellulomonas composti]|uniref:O-succinylbenzoic acid--CoA ligase n=1 Tax=Cellulomonas composti TaxID=266130 RepID=A0A511JEG1_9CELL|nr:o-succinylbenzoate--CoA ligase [Cellulomonas composti]GEL96378.1 O-succinylbenzoic acid--CoA ligase [Cellulomonas composti]